MTLEHIVYVCYEEHKTHTSNGYLLQKSGGKAHGFNRGMKAKKLFAIIGQ